MKKVLFILFNLLTITTMAQIKGRFEVYDLDNCKLHVYYTNDALGDASHSRLSLVNYLFHFFGHFWRGHVVVQRMALEMDY